jgi:hypothetical protein
VDYDKKFYFIERSTYTAPFNITDTSGIVNVNVRNDRSKYRNRQYLRGGTTPTDSAITGESPSPKPDGIARTFTLRYPVSEKPTIYVNGTPVASNQVGINGVDGKVTPLQWYYSVESNTITQDSSQTVLSTTDSVTVDYIGLVPLLVVVEDSVAIASRASLENNSGVYEALETMPNLNDKQQAFDTFIAKIPANNLIVQEALLQTILREFMNESITNGYVGTIEDLANQMGHGIVFEAVEVIEEEPKEESNKKERKRRVKKGGAGSDDEQEQEHLFTGEPQE